MSTRNLIIDQCQFFVLDEADRMLDLGFMPDIRRVVAQLPARRQSALFSATMPKEILSLAEGLLREPVRVSIEPVASTPVLVEQHVHFVEGSGKRHLLSTLLRDSSLTRAIVFTRTKRGADRVALQLTQEKISATAMHGNLGQNARQRALEDFRAGNVRVLVATDLAARGIDVMGVSHAVSYTHLDVYKRQAEHDGVAFAWGALQQGEDEAAEGVVGAFRGQAGQMQAGFYFVDGGEAVEFVEVGFGRVGAFLGAGVVGVADDGFEHVGGGDHALKTAVFVEHDGDAQAVGFEALQGFQSRN